MLQKISYLKIYVEEEFILRKYHRGKVYDSFGRTSIPPDHKESGDPPNLGHDILSKFTKLTFDVGIWANSSGRTMFSLKHHMEFSWALCSHIFLGRGQNIVYYLANRVDKRQTLKRSAKNTKCLYFINDNFASELY